MELSVGKLWRYRNGEQSPKWIGLVLENLRGLRISDAQIKKLGVVIPNDPRYATDWPPPSFNDDEVLIWEEIVSQAPAEKITPENGNDIALATQFLIEYREGNYNPLKFGA